MSSRLHAPVMTAAAVAAGELIELRSPAVGIWRASVRPGEVVQAGETLGELTVLGVAHRVIAGAGAGGAVRSPDSPGASGPSGPSGPSGVDVGWPLLVLDPSVVAGVAAGAESRDAAAQTGGLTVRAPSSGRYYGRPGPGKPAFVAVGDVIREGHTVCLLEVMKTFNRVTYGGGGLPAEARVIAIAVADESDVTGGDVLLQLEAVS
jgi:acetyl-CoA carboxylase biotin carboxyl carrier protein